MYTLIKTADLLASPRETSFLPSCPGGAETRKEVDYIINACTNGFQSFPKRD